VYNIVFTLFSWQIKYDDDDVRTAKKSQKTECLRRDGYISPLCSTVHTPPLNP